MANDDVEVRITGSLDPSLATSAAAARAQIDALVAAGEKLSQNQRTWAAAVLQGKISLDELAVSYGKTDEGMEAFAAISAAVTKIQNENTAAVEQAVTGRISLTKAEAEALAVRKAMTAQQAQQTISGDAAAFALAQRLTQQRVTEEKSAAKEEEAIAAATLAFQQRMNRQRASESSATAAAVEKEAASQQRLLTATVPLAAAQQKLSAVTTAANAQLAAGNISETQHAAAIAAATTAYNTKIAALLKSGAAIETETGAIVANTVAQEADNVVRDQLIKKALSGRSVMEGEALMRGILTGNMTRVASAAAVEAARLNLVQYAFSATGAAVAGFSAALIAGLVAMEQYEAAEHKLEASAAGLGATSGNTANDLRDLANTSAGTFKQSINEAEASVIAFNNEGIRSKQVILDLSETSNDFATLTGQKTAAAVKELASAMKEPTKGAEELNAQLHFLDAEELDQIRTLDTLGEKTKAQALLTQKLKENDDEATAASGKLTSGLKELTDAATGAWREMGKLVDELSHYLALAGAMGSDMQLRAIHDEAATDIAKLRGGTAGRSKEAQRKEDSIIGGALIGDTPENKALERRRELTGDVLKITTKLNEDMAAHKGADVIMKDNAALREYVFTLKSYHTETERKVAIDQLDVKIAEAKRSLHGKAREDAVAELATQKALLNTRASRGEVQSEADAKAEAAGAGAAAGARAGPGGKGRHGPGPVQGWAEELHAQEEASNDFFGDQTQRELQFWQGKLAITTKGSKDWLEVQAKIYEAQKKLAHESYDDHLANLNDQLEANKDDWSKEQSLWSDKLQFIADHFTKESKEYHAAHKEFEAAEREHQKVMLEIQRTDAQAGLAELRSTLGTNKAIREEDMREAESELKFKAKYSGNPLAEIHAEQQIAAMHRQTAAQNIHDMEQEQVEADKLLQADIDAAHKGTAEYEAAVKKKEQADIEFANKHRQMMNQMANQEKADLQNIQAAWHSRIDPMVQSVGTQFKGLIMGTETWGQALRNVEADALSMVVDAIEKMIEKWIVNMIVGKAAGESEVATQAGLAGAGGVASMAAAPFPLDLTAPAFGAEMFATAMAFGQFAQGANVVPDDMIAQIHAGERIIPAADNRQMMSMMDNRSSHGDTNITLTHSPTVTNPTVNIMRELERNKNDFARLLKSMHRDGHFRFAK